MDPAWIQLTTSDPQLTPAASKTKPRTVSYQRHELPAAAGPARPVTPLSTPLTPVHPTPATPPRTGRRVRVAVPRIFVEMAFTGHYDSVTIPRDRLRYFSSVNIQLNVNQGIDLSNRDN